MFSLDTRMVLILVGIVFFAILYIKSKAKDIEEAAALKRELEKRETEFEKEAAAQKRDLERSIAKRNAEFESELDSRKRAFEKKITEKETMLRAYVESKEQALEEREAEVSAQMRALGKKEVEHEAAVNDFNSAKQEVIDNYHKMLSDDKQNYPWMATQIADFEYYNDIEIAEYLKNKPHPAMTAAQQVSQIAKEKRLLQKQVKLYEYQLNFLENLFPWLPSFEQINVKEAMSYALDAESDYDNMRDYLSPEEYSRLSSAEKSDLALARWKNKSHGEWGAGRDYERYIGYLFETAGYRVEYVGALLGKEDRGIDLIAKKGTAVKIIQCKRYSATKNHIVHENTVAQLFGATAVYNMENPSQHADGVIYTSSTLSEEAKKFAEYLNITVMENVPLKDYPIIKCNTNQYYQKIYHLPFDPQYDRLIVAGKKQTFYIATAAEAERLGYRRAYRWTVGQ